MSVIVAGAIAGAAHVVTGPDHLAAVAPLIAERPHQGWRLGLRWGVGHGFGVLLLGLAGVLLRDQIDVDLLSSYSERLVGVLLIVIGVWALWRSRGVVVHRHAHHHPADEHAHEHQHEPGLEHAHVHVHASPTFGKSGAVFGIGLLHGAAGTGHFLGVLPSLALQGSDSVVYLLTYFCSAIFAMTFFGWSMSKFIVDSQRIAVWMQVLAVCSIAVGIYWLELL